MKKIILIGLLTLAFVPVRCMNNQQEKLYMVNRYGFWRECKNLGEYRDELREAGFLFVYDDTEKVSNYVFCTFGILGGFLGKHVVGWSLASLIMYGLRFGFKGLGNWYGIMALSFIGFSVLKSYCVEGFFENRDEVIEILFGKEKEKRKEYINKKKKEDANFDIYKYI